MSVQREISGTELVKRRLSSRNFVSYRKFEEISFFVPGKFCSKGLELSLKLSRELSWKVRMNKERNSRISLALLLHNTVNRKWTKRKPQTRALAFCLVFVDIRFLLVSLKHEKFHIPVKLYLCFNLSIITANLNENEMCAELCS